MPILAEQLSTHKLSSAATTNATSVKATPGRMVALLVSNINAAARFLKLYDKAAAPVVGTDVPTLTVTIPAGGQVSVELGPLGVSFPTGIAYAITGLAPDADVTAVAANDVKVLMCYQ